MSGQSTDKGIQSNLRTCQILQPDNKAMKKRKKKKYSYQNDDCYSNKYNFVQNQNENINVNLNLNIYNGSEIEGIYEDEYQGLMYYPRNNDIENIYKDDYNNFKAKWKTEICRYWEMYGQCKFGDNCAFAHGDSELKQRKMTFNYKTKPCKQFFELGYCSYGSRCQFSHKKESEDKNDKNNDISYLKIIKEFLSSEKEISHELLKRPRLMTFEKITESTLEESEKSKLKLYEDIINIKQSGIKLSEDTNYSNISNDKN